MHLCASLSLLLCSLSPPVAGAPGQWGFLRRGALTLAEGSLSKQLSASVDDARQTRGPRTVSSQDPSELRSRLSKTFSTAEMTRASQMLKSFRGHDKLRFEHLSVMKPLGRGAFGEVSSYKWGRSADEVAVKRGEQESLRNEAELYSFLESHPHPNLLKFHGLFTPPGEELSVLVLEKAEGKTIFELPNKASHARDVLGQLLSVLRHLSSLGIAHRDLHSKNVMFDEESRRLKLLDLGLARADSDHEGFMKDLSFLLRFINDLIEGRSHPRQIRVSHTEDLSLSDILEILSGLRVSGHLKRMLLELIQNREDLPRAYSLALQSDWMSDHRTEEELRRLRPKNMHLLSHYDFEQQAYLTNPLFFHSFDEDVHSELGLPLPPSFSGSVRHVFPSVAVNVDGDLREALLSLPSQVMLHRVDIRSHPDYVLVMQRLSRGPALPGLPFGYGQLEEGGRDFMFIAEAPSMAGFKLNFMTLLMHKSRGWWTPSDTPRRVPNLALGLIQIAASLSRVGAHAESFSPEDVYVDIRCKEVDLLSLRGVRDGEGDSGRAVAELLLRLGGFRGPLPGNLEDALPLSSLRGEAAELVLLLVDPSLFPDEKLERAARKARGILHALNEAEQE